MALTNHILPDSPTNNFCTLNPLSTAGSTTTPITISDGNLKTVHSVTGQWQGAKGTISVSSGIWYFEVVILQVPTGITQNYNIGFYNADIHNGLYYGLAGNLTFGANGSAAQLYVNTSYTSYGSLGSNGSIYMFCLDVDSEKFWVGLNGSWFASGNPSTGVNPSASGFGKSNWTTVQSDYTYSGAGSFQHNYGQDPTFGGNKTSGSADAPDAKGIGAFYYQPPTGALALCTANLTDFTPTVTGDTPQDYFKAVTWTNATTDIDVTVNLPFQADMIWWKQRDQANSHRLIDSVRGLTSELTPNSDIGEAIIDPTTRKYNVTVINADNFKFNGYVNTATRGGPMVGWCWKAGGSPSGSTSTTGSAKRINTSGTQDDTSCSALATAATNAGASNVITPTLMSINQAAGFSIATYSISSTTSANDFTIPHGLNKAPEFIIVKSTTGTQQWCVYHHSESSKAGFLQRYIGFTTSEHTNNFNGTVPTSQVFTVGHPTNNNSGDTCRDGHSYVAYCFHGVEGYSKFGSYTGNGSTDGPFLYCGFRPAFVMYKNIGAISSAFASWGMIDSSRSSYNPTGGGNTLWANMSTQEGYRGNGTNLIGANDYLNFDFVSNGFKLRGSGNNTETNDNAQVYIFMAFAEQPFKFSNAR